MTTHVIRPSMMLNVPCYRVDSITNGWGKLAMKREPADVIESRVACVLEQNKVDVESGDRQGRAERGRHDRR
jgi:hypothetical protein